MNNDEILIKICRDVEMAVKALQAGEALPDFQSNDNRIDDDTYQHLIVTWADQIQLETQLRKQKGSKSDADRTQISDRRHHIFHKLAEIFVQLEHNGDATHEGDKLAFLFPSAQAAREWLSYYAEEYAQENSITQPIHQLCLNITINTQNVPMPPFFKLGPDALKRIFSSMDALRRFTQGLPYVIDYLENKLNRKEQFSFDEILGQIDKQFEIEENKEALVAMGFVLEDLTSEERKQIEQIKSINKRYGKNPYDSLKMIMDALKKAKNSDDFLPNITMTSESIDLPPGFYMAKLPDNDVRCALAGMLTGCCQYIGEDHEPGEVCALHAIQSDLGATYAIFRGKVENGKTQIDIENDRPVVMSWAWRNEGLVCFDSIEFDSVGRESLKKMYEGLETSQAMTPGVIIDRLYVGYSAKLIEKDKTITQINVGTGGNTPDDVGAFPMNMDELKTLTSAPKGYGDGYRDSQHQRTLASRAHPQGFHRNSVAVETPLIPWSPPDDNPLYIRFLEARTLMIRSPSLENDESTAKLIEVLDEILRDPTLASRVMEDLFSFKIETLRTLRDKMSNLEKHVHALKVIKGEETHALITRKLDAIIDVSQNSRDSNFHHTTYTEIPEILGEIQSKENAAWFINALGLPRDSQARQRLINLIPYDEITRLVPNIECAKEVKAQHKDRPYLHYQETATSSNLPTVKAIQSACVDIMKTLDKTFDETMQSIERASLEDIRQALWIYKTHLPENNDNLQLHVFYLILKLEAFTKEKSDHEVKYRTLRDNINSDLALYLDTQDPSANIGAEFDPHALEQLYQFVMDSLREGQCTALFETRTLHKPH